MSRRIEEKVRSERPCRGQRRARGLSPISVGVASLLCSLPACSRFADGSDMLGTTTSNSDAERAEPGFDWSCLEEGGTTSVAPFVVASESERVIYSARIVDFTTRDIARGVSIRACVVTDVNCSQPITSPIFASEDGWFDVPLFRGFDGYLEYGGDNYVPHTLYLTEPMSASITLDFPLHVIDLDSLSSLSGLIGVNINPEAGLISVRSFDCQGVTADGVMLNKSGDGVRWYFADGLPTSAETRTGGDGLGGWVNVPPGLAAVAAVAPTGAAISGEQTLVVRPGGVATAYIWPRGTRPRAPAQL